MKRFPALSHFLFFLFNYLKIEIILFFLLIIPDMVIHNEIMCFAHILKIETMSEDPAPGTRLKQQQPQAFDTKTSGIPPLWKVCPLVLVQI